MLAQLKLYAGKFIFCTTESDSPRKFRDQHTKLSVKNTTGYKGVSRSGNLFKVRIYHEGKAINVGHFSSEIDAAEAYDAKAKELFGTRAILNFKD